MNLLVTGGAGFIGSHFIRHILNKYSDHTVVNLDALTYAGSKSRLRDLENFSNYHFIYGDIKDGMLVEKILGNYEITHIVNSAAETHVDRSIVQPKTFVETNVLGTQVLLDAAREFRIEKFVQISTDEVYGSLERSKEYFTEETLLQPNSPYSASKAGADMFVRSYNKTYGVNANIIRSSNNYGAYQFPEKLIPLMIINAIKEIKLPVYGDGKNMRDWLHVKDHCQAIDMVLHNGKSGEIYNVSGKNEKMNNEIIQLIIHELGISRDLINYVKDRPGHDRRYAVDSTLIEEMLNWKPKVEFDHGIIDTIKWYVNNKDWWEPLKSQCI